MDHLILPQESISGYPRVPYTCGEVDLNESFLTFSHSYAEKWKVIPSSKETGFENWLYSAAQAHTVTEVEAFLQHWIFFGLLHELLEPVALFDAADYISEDENGAFIHTRNLVERIHSWDEHIGRWDVEARQRLGHHLYECLSLAYMSLSGFYSIDQKKELDLDQDVRNSNLIIFETISGIGDASLNTPSEGDVWPHVRSPLKPTDSMLRQMLANGWCRSEIPSIQDKFACLETQLYIFQMRRYTEGLDHGQCTDTLCTQLQIRESTEDGTFNGRAYRPVHMSETCMCDYISPDPAEIAACLDSGSFPLLMVKNLSSGDLTVEVTPYSEDTPYVAISHVWADGLGNPEATQLPRCQASRLQALANSMHGCTFKWGDDGEERTEQREMLLWCDSLCCPTEREDQKRRNLALAKMREVYASAAYVLMIDRELETISYNETDVIERVARFVTTRWTKRLWTFQEAALAKKLLIRFADCTVDFRDLASDLKDLMDNSALNRGLLRDIYVPCVEMRTWRSKAKSHTTRIGLLTGAIRQRSTTKSTDEPLCLAVALGLDVGEVARAEPLKRMGTFWRLCSGSVDGIPSDIIFNKIPRLREDGYRWAPASFRQPLNDECRLVIKSRGNGKGVWTPHGLRIQRLGWRVESAQPLWGMGLLSDLSRDRMFTVRAANGEWHAVSEFTKDVVGGSNMPIWTRLQDRTKDWYIILDTVGETDRISRGLLTYAEQASGCIVHRSVCVLNVYPRQPDWQTYHDVIHEHAAALQQRKTMRTLQLQLVCERLIESFAAWMPHIFRGRLLRLCRFVIRMACGDASVRFKEMLQQQTQKLAESPEGIKLSQKIFKEQYKPLWESEIIAVMKGFYGVIKESYDSTKEWIVD